VPDVHEPTSWGAGATGAPNDIVRNVVIILLSPATATNQDSKQQDLSLSRYGRDIYVVSKN
jgi:hypothetical protein